MGINGFGNFYKNNCAKEKEVNNFLGDVLVIDAIFQLFRYAIAYRKKGKDMCNPQGERIIHLWALMKYTLYLLRIGITPFYVFDGKSPDLKKDTIENRNTIKSKALVKLLNLEDDKESKEYIKNFKKTYSLTSQEIKDCLELLDLMGIPNIRAKGEADSYCAALSKTDKFYGVISNDTDLLVFGAKKLLKNFSGKKTVEEISLEDVYKFTKFKANEILMAHNKDPINDNFITHEMFVDFSILLGSDYTPHIKGFDSKLLFEQFVLNEFNIDKTIAALKNMITSLPKNKHDAFIPENFLEKAHKAKQYYLQYVSTNIEIDKATYALREPNKEKLHSFLCEKHGFTEQSVVNFTEELEKFYFTLRAFNNKKNDSAFKSFRGYQFKYYQNLFDPKISKNKNRLYKGNFIKQKHKEITKPVKKTNIINNNMTNRFASLTFLDA
ncbi:FLAP-like endonuclease XPG [Catovirus CTV1]|uniref:FLAP-like endonuclease XPG n=1 Tax=Catovirus CTV1 TaxID=1977631 RepID=A0A1V0SBX4_9VIRU|nr:FLAP-like endonuclease XPG [Catovirus CTV1]